MRVVADIPTDLITGNDAARAGRLPLLVCCPVCGDPAPRVAGWLGPGRWAITHAHGGHWSAHPLPHRTPATERTPQQ